MAQPTRGGAVPPDDPGQDRALSPVDEEREAQEESSPWELERALAVFVEGYSQRRYHESPDNVTPAGVYDARRPAILARLERIEQRTLAARRRENLKTPHGAARRQNRLYRQNLSGPDWFDDVQKCQLEEAGMTKIRRVAFVTCLIMIAPSVVAVYDALDTRPLCARSKDWTVNHVSSLPSTLEQLEAYPVSYRKPILAAMTNEARAIVWRQHLSQWSRASTTSQRDVIARAIAFVTPEVMANPEAYHAEALEIAKAGREAFGAPVAQEIFERVGGSASKAYRSLPALRIYVSESLRNAFALRASSSFCRAHCSTYSDWCANGYTCVWVPEWCEHTSSGCGTFGLFACNGWCDIVPAPSSD